VVFRPSGYWGVKRVSQWAAASHVHVHDNRVARGGAARTERRRAWSDTPWSEGDTTSGGRGAQSYVLNDPARRRGPVSDSTGAKLGVWL